MMRDLKLHTVCEEAHCPTSASAGAQGRHLHDLGDVCTRNCAYCAVAMHSGSP